MEATMPQSILRGRKRFLLATALGGAFLTLISGNVSKADDDEAGEGKTATPIKRVIVLIGENRSFDNIYGMYRPREGQSVSNLLSKGIVTSSGDPVPNSPAKQFQIKLPLSTPSYFI